MSNKTDEDHLASLIRAGIITHRINNPQTLDPLFAVSQLRDLPEVQFVAAFQNGLIVLGCPDGVPDGLADLVRPMHAPLGQPAPPSTAVENKLDRLMARMDDLQTRDNDPLVPLLAKMDVVAARLDYLVDGMMPDAPDADSPPSAPPEGVALAIGALQNQIEGVAAKLEQPRTDAGLVEEIKSAIATIIPPAPDQDGPPKADALAEATADLASQLTEMAAAVTDIQTGITTLRNNTTDASGQKDSITEAMAFFSSKLDALANAVKYPETKNDAFAEVKTQIEELHQKMDTSGALAAIDARLDALHHHAAEVTTPIMTLNDRLDGLAQDARSEVANLKSGVDALVEHAATQTTDAPDLDLILETLDSLRADIRQPPHQLNPQASSEKTSAVEITTTMEALPMILQQAIKTGLDLMPLHKTLSHLQGDVAMVPDQLGTLANQMAALSERQAANDAQLSAKLIELVEKLTVGPSQTNPDAPAFSKQRGLTNTDVSLEDIRHLFAELVATQVKNDADPSLDGDEDTD